MTPIQTRFDGYYFRSRTEARYAVMFRCLGWPYEFEMQGFSLDRGPFLPDFWLHRRGWFEVKGRSPSDYDKDLMRCLAIESDEFAAISVGTPSDWNEILLFLPGGSFTQTNLFDYLSARSSTQDALAAIDAARSARFEFGETPEFEAA